jgi:hypothetical protein
MVPSRPLLPSGQIVNSSPAKRAAGVGAAQACLQSPSDGLQHGVALVMPQVIVDAFEVIEVQEEHGHRIGLSTCWSQRALEAIRKRDAVGQAGQCIVLEPAA